MQQRLIAMARDPDDNATPQPLIAQVREIRVRKWASENPNAEINLSQFKVIK